MNKVLATRAGILALILSTTILLFIKETVVIFVISLIIFFSSFIFDRKKKILLRLYPLFAVAVFIVLFQLLFNTTLSLTQRFMQGLTAALKLFSLSMLVFLFAEVISIKQIIDALSFLPKKIQLAIIITFSMIPSIFEESQKILMAQNSRGYNTRSLNFVKSIIPFIIPLLHRILRKAEQITIVIQSRGYDEK